VIYFSFFVVICYFSFSVQQFSVVNHSDEQGRYRYSAQPSIISWNLARFADALAVLPGISRSRLDSIVASFDTHYSREFYNMMRRKLGLRGEERTDSQLVDDLFLLMEESHMDFHNTFRVIAKISAGQQQNYNGDKLEKGDAQLLYRAVSGRAVIHRPSHLEFVRVGSASWSDWLRRYRSRVGDLPDSLRKSQMDAVNPRYVLRNYLVQEAIAEAEKGNYQTIRALQKVLADPFTFHPGMDTFAQNAPTWTEKIELSCSS
jgi:uncharacterized protein YdiU (UPF0061 family)